MQDGYKQRTSICSSPHISDAQKDINKKRPFYPYNQLIILSLPTMPFGTTNCHGWCYQLPHLMQPTVAVAGGTYGSWSRLICIMPSSALLFVPLMIYNVHS